MPTRFFCCLMFAIRERTLSRAGPRGRVMVAEALPTIPRNCGRMSELDPAVDPALEAERAHRRRLARSPPVFGGATALSRVLGLVREMVAAYAFGAAGKINAFTVAFQIPNLVRALVADT